MPVSVSPSGELQPGSNATLKCQVDGPSPGPSLKWKKPDNKPIESHTVEIKSVELSDAGTWKCEFSWNGKMETVSLNIKVKGETMYLLLYQNKVSLCDYWEK